MLTNKQKILDLGGHIENEFVKIFNKKGFTVVVSKDQYDDVDMTINGIPIQTKGEVPWFIKNRSFTIEKTQYEKYLKIPNLLFVFLKLPWYANAFAEEDLTLEARYFKLNYMNYNPNTDFRQKRDKNGKKVYENGKKVYEEVCLFPMKEGQTMNVLIKDSETVNKFLGYSTSGWI